MNKIYRTVWNESTQSLVVVSELAKSAGKSSQNLVKSGVFKSALSALTVAIGLAVSGQAYAGPTIYMNDGKDGACTGLYDQSWNTGMYALEGRTNTIDYRVTALTSGSTTNTNRTPGHFSLVSGYNPCLSDGSNAQKNDTQTNRTLFYGNFDSASPTDNGAKNLTLGGRLDVNSGIIAVGNRGVNGVDSKFRPTNNYKIYGTNTHYQSTNSIRMGTGITLNEGNNKEAAIAIGVDTKATNTGAIAVGWQAEAGYENVAIGQRARATNNQSIAIGAHTSATGDQSTAIGNNTVATGNSAVAIGGDDLDTVSKVGNDWNQSNTAKAYKRLTGDDLVGPTTYISTQAGDAAVAVGVQAKAGGALSTAFGTRTEATGLASLALGVGAKVTRENAVAIGAGSVADNTVVGTPETTATIPTANGQPLTYTFSGGANTTENDIVSFGKVGFERQLKHVAAGKIADGSTDAVNGSQLYAVASKIQTQLTHYYSVKSTEQAAGSNYNNDGATGTNALAAGVKTVATGDSSVAVGTEAKTESQNSIAVGTQAKVSAVDSVAIGLNAQVLPGQPGTPTPTATAVAIGANSKAQNKSAVALGSQAEATGAESAALGSVAKATGASSLAMGPNAQASALSATAVGNTAKASGDRSIALGQAANALSRDDTAIGAGATTLAGNGWATAVGIGTQAHGVATLASGYLAKAHGERATALGAEALASVEFATAIGAKANATGESAIALGKQANASAGTAIAMGKESKATHGGAVALGNKAESTNNQAVAIGEEAKASGQQGSALGYKSQASGMSSTALGLNSVASGGGSTAIGADSKATDSQTIAIGQSSTAAGLFDVSIGYEAHAITAGAHTSTGNNIAIGQAALKDAVNANNNTAIGTSAGYKLKGTHTVSIGTHANLGQEANKSVAIGYHAETSKDSSLAFGNTAKASGFISNAIGTSSKASGNYSNAFGYGAEALGASSIAIGGAQSLNSNTQATKNFSIAVGYNSKAKETNAIAIGANALASGSSSISIGTGNQVTGANSGALGDPSYISGRGTYTIGNDNGTAAAPIAANNAGAFGNGNLMGAGAEGSRIVGNGNNIQQANTFVVGNDVTTTQGNSVVLGAGSTDRAATTETTGVISGITYGTFAGPGSAANGVVSVGKAGGERQIINVAAGNVSPTSTDAINGSQLYATNNVLTNAVNSLDDILGGNAAVTPNGPNAGKFSMTNIGNTGKGNIHEAIAASRTEVKAGNNVTIDDSEQTADGHKVYKVTAEGTKVVHETGSPVVVDQGTRDAATNMTTYKVDLTQAAKDSLAKADTAVQDVKLVGGETNLTLNKANNVVELGLTKTPTFDKVTAGTGANQVVLGNNGVEVGGNVYISNDGLNANNKVIDNVAPGAIAANSKQAVNGGQLHTLKTEGFKVNADNNEEKTNALGSTVSIVAGNATDTSTDNLATKVEQDGTGTKVTVSMKNAPTFTGKVTAKGLDASGEKITNVKAGSDNLDAVNFAQLKAVQDAVKVAQSGAWELQGNGTKVKSVGAGDKVNFAHGTGTTAAVTLDPASGVPTVNYSVNTATLSAGQDGKVAPSATGDVFATAEQVAGAINAASFTLASANSGNENTNTAKISAGGKVTVDAGKNLTTTQNGSVITVATKDDVEFTSVKAGDSTLNGNGLTINGGPSITKTGGVNAGGKQIANVASGGNTATNAANIGDVQTAAAAAKTEVKAGNNVTIDDTEQTADGHKVYKVTAEGTKVVHETGSPVVVDPGTRDAATNMTTYKVDLTQAAKDSLAKANTAVQDVKLVGGETNLTLNKANNVVELGLTKTPTFDKVTAGTGANQVVLGNNGVEVGGNVYISNDGLNANNKVIDNVAPGAIAANSKQAVNGGQLHTLKTEGFKVNADNNEEKTNALGSTVSIVAGNATDTSTDNLATKVEQDGTGTKVTVSMKNAPTFTGKVTAKGLDASGEKITNVKAGSDNLDAVNFAQLKAVQDAVKVAQSGAWELQGNGTKVKSVGAGDKVNFAHGTGTTAAVTLDPASGVPTVNYSVNTATLSAGQDGKVAPSATGDVFATAEQVAGAINAASFTLASANSGNENTNTAKISAGGKVTVDAGKNLTTTQNGSVITVATKDDVEFTSVKAGDSTLNGNGLTINGGPSITKTGGVNAGGKQIANVASGGNTATNAANIGDVQTAAAAAKTEVKAGNNVTIDDTEQTADGHKVYKVTAEGTKVVHETGSPVVVDPGTRDAATNMTTYKVDLTQAAKDSLAKVATNAGNITALQNQTFKLQANNDVATPVKASDTVKFIDGDNINITRSGNDITVSTAKDVTFDKVTAGTGTNQVVLGNNGVEVGGNVYISNDGLNANNKVISNVAPGAINANSAEAINGSQLHATNVAVQALQAGVAAAQVEVQAGNNVAVDLSKGSKGQNIYTVHAEKTTVSGSNMVNVTAGPRSATGVTNYAVDLSQQAKADIADGVAAKNIVDNKGITFTADSGTTGVKKLGDSVAVNGDNKNITTKATPNGVEVSLNNSISVANISADAVNIKNGPSLNQNGLQMANTPITGMASGLPIDPVTGKPMTTVQIEQGIIDGTIDPAVLQNGVSVSDLAAQAQNAAQVNNIIYGTDSDGNPYVNGNGTMTSAGRAALRTYNVDGKGTYERNGIFSAIKNMNEQGIKFFHTNDGVVQSVKDGTSEEDSNAEAAYSTAIGYKARVEETAVGGLAIGAGARAVSAGSVALGAQSEAADVHVAAGTRDNAYTYGGLNDDHVAGKPTSATSVLSVGKPGAERQVQNVAAGVISETSTDAVNGSQLYQTNRAVENNTRAINQLRGDVHKMDNKLRAGVAGAYAAASLGQVYIPGKTQVSLGSGHYRGESAVALGVSRVSDNGKVQVRLIGSTNTRGDTGAGASVSYLW